VISARKTPPATPDRVIEPYKVDGRSIKGPHSYPAWWQADSARPPARRQVRCRGNAPGPRPWTPAPRSPPGGHRP
jgi:hypothetical protein